MTSLEGDKHCGFISDCCPLTTSPISKDLEYAIIQAIAFSLLQVIVFFGGCLVWTRYHCDWGFCRGSRSAEDAGACVACPFSRLGLPHAAYPIDHALIEQEHIYVAPPDCHLLVEVGQVVSVEMPGTKVCNVQTFYVLTNIK